MGIASAVSADSALSVTLSFRDSVTIRDTMIYVRDIAAVTSDDPETAALVDATAAGESAPPGYSRFIGPEELLMFRLRPIFKDIDFKANTKNRIPVKTACNEKKTEEFSDHIRDYLRRQSDWSDTQWSVALLNPETSWKCYQAPLDVTIEGLTNRNPKGMVRLQLVAKQGTKTFRIPVVCRISLKLPVCVAKREIHRGTIFDINDLELKICDCSDFGFTPIVSLAEAAGKKALKSIKAGTVLHGRMLGTLPVVSKGDAITIVMERGRVKISVSGIARENGLLGRKIWVENATTHRFIRVTIKDKNTVELL